MPTVKFNTPDGDILFESLEAVGTKGFMPGGTRDVVGQVLDGGSFEAALSRLKAVGNAIARTLGEIATPPQSAEVELSLKLTAAAGAVFAKVGAEADMNIKLTWQRLPSE